MFVRKKKNRSGSVTMIPIVDDFVRRFSLKDFVIVADSGLMSAKNMKLLRSAGYVYRGSKDQDGKDGGARLDHVAGEEERCCL